MIPESGFGPLLRNFRRSHHLTQTELARRAYLSQSYISELEAGKCRPTDRTYVEVLAHGLNLDAESRKRLFEAAGFVPLRLDESTNSSVYWDIDRVVNKLLLFSNEKDVVVRDLLERIDNWTLYQQAEVAALSDMNFTRYVCKLIAGKERRSALITRVAKLYATAK